jgi:membrane protein DedA with SNARE-associated domain
VDGHHRAPQVTGGVLAARADGRRSNRAQIIALAVPIVVITVGAYVGDALTTTWADTHPLALMALNARNRILILVTNKVDATSYYVVGAARLLLTDPLWFLIGLLSGDTALRWVSRQGDQFGRIVSWIERNFSKAAIPFVLVAPNNIVSLLAGATGMNVGLFFGLNIVGTIARLYLIRVLGSTFQAPIDDVLHFFARYRVPLLAASVLIVGVNVWQMRRRGGGELGELKQLTENVVEDDPRPERGGPRTGAGDE